MRGVESESLNSLFDDGEDLVGLEDECGVDEEEVGGEDEGE